MNILGISAFYHNSAACLVQDGVIVAAAQKERFTRRKHDSSLPANAIHYCLEEARLEPGDLDAVVFCEKPLLKAERLLDTYVGLAPRGLRSFWVGIPTWLRHKGSIPTIIRKQLGRQYTGPVLFTEHHESHAASAFFPSPFESAAILTIDGVGEWATTTIGISEGNRIELKWQIRFPHSLDLLYSAFAQYTGFKVNSGEYKLMGLAPHGEPKYPDTIRKEIVRINDDGSFWLNQKYFDYCGGLTMTNRRFHRLFGGPPRRQESEVTQKDMDLAASIQSVTEEIMLRLACHAKRISGNRNLCLAGGVALNCVANGHILREGPFDRIWIQPAAGDAGGARSVWHQMLGNPRTPAFSDKMRGAFLGPEFSDEETAAYLDTLGIRAEPLSDSELIETVARLINEGNVVGWFQGRMEFGPRALGARSILGGNDLSDAYEFYKWKHDGQQCRQRD